MNFIPDGSPVVEDLNSEILEKYKTHSRFKVFYHKGFTCPICGIVANKFIKFTDVNGGNHIDIYHYSENKKELMTVDHIIPKSKGGSNKLSNLQPMCCKCNIKKGNKTNIKNTPELSVKKQIETTEKKSLFVLYYENKLMYSTTDKGNHKKPFVYLDERAAKEAMKTVAIVYKLDINKISIESII